MCFGLFLLLLFLRPLIGCFITIRNKRIVFVNSVIGILKLVAQIKYVCRFYFTVGIEPTEISIIDFKNILRRKYQKYYCKFTIKKTSKSIGLKAVNYFNNYLTCDLIK